MTFIKFNSNKENTHILFRPDVFNHVSATEYRQQGAYAIYTRKDGGKVAMNYDQESGRYVVWQIDAIGQGYTTFLSRAEATRHAAHCASVIYLD